MTMKGGCLCSAVRYEISGEPEFAGKCYCTDCQKESGAGHLTIIIVPDGDLAFEGDMNTFEKKGDSGTSSTRSFCPQCGTTLMSQSQLMAGKCFIRAGTLDESDGLEIERAIYCKSARNWDLPPADVPQVPGMPS